MGTEEGGSQACHAILPCLDLHPPPPPLHFLASLCLMKGREPYRNPQPLPGLPLGEGC